MNIFYIAYKLLGTLLTFIGIIPFLIFTVLSGKYGENLKERFGYIPNGIKRTPSHAIRIWIHAVSLGEIKVAKSIVAEIKTSSPECSVVLSTTTEHGRALAKEMFPSEVQVIYAPIDIFLVVKKVIRLVNPDILIFLETEIWPSWIIESRKQGVKIVLLNGRISERSFKNYLKLKWFFKKVLESFDHLSMISKLDRDRITMLGANPEKTSVNGNAKYDLIFNQVMPGKAEEIREKLGIAESAPVIVAGSTRTGEDDILLKSYKKILKEIPDTILILAPRHLERVDYIIRLLEKEDFGYHLWTEFDAQVKERQKSIIIIDKYGELFNIYSISTLAFCGASLVPLGGQNPFEPAAWSVPVFHGPHMDDFQDARLLLDETGGNVVVNGEDEFTDNALKIINDRDLLKKKGEAAREAFLKNHLAAERQAAIVNKLINELKRKEK